jgi:hypothetical protein
MPVKNYSREAKMRSGEAQGRVEAEIEVERRWGTAHGRGKEVPVFRRDAVEV